MVQNWERSISGLYTVTRLFNFMQSTYWEMSGWMNPELESRLLGEISTTSDMQMITLMAESKKEIKRLLMKVEDESKKAGLKQRSKN